MSNSDCLIRFPDDVVGQFPMAYVVRKAGSTISGVAVMDFIAKQVIQLDLNSAIFVRLQNLALICYLVLH